MEPGSSSFGETHVSGDNATFFQASRVVFPPATPGSSPDGGPPREENDRRTRRVMIVVAVIGAVGAVVAALIGGFFTLKANDRKGPEFKVSAHCDRPGAVLSSVASGFTPGGGYTVEILDPDGFPYEGENTVPSGTVTPNGSIAWRWHCVQGARPGGYRIRAEDVSSGEHTAWSVFRITPS